MGMIAAQLNENGDLLLPPDLPLPATVRLEYDACLQAFLQGKREEAYAHISTILQHYHDLGESIPEPCGHLYFSLLVKDVAQEEPSALRILFGEEKAAQVLNKMA